MYPGGSGGDREGAMPPVFPLTPVIGLKVQIS